MNVKETVPRADIVRVISGGYTERKIWSTERMRGMPTFYVTGGYYCTRLRNPSDVEPQSHPLDPSWILEKCLKGDIQSLQRYLKFRFARYFRILASRSCETSAILSIHRAPTLCKRGRKRHASNRRRTHVWDKR
jgi:hypothetical protein